MLVITLKHQERARLLLPDGREIWITLTHVGGDRCRIGFTAPEDVKIHRASLLPQPTPESRSCPDSSAAPSADAP